MDKATYIAKYNGKQSTVETDFMDLHGLVAELNEKGFGLGSGHDGIAFHMDTMILELIPYVGAWTQYINFFIPEK